MSLQKQCAMILVLLLSTSQLSHCMESEEEKEIEQMIQPAHADNERRFNILGELPLELIDVIMDLLPIGNSGYNYLKLYRKLGISRKKASEAIDNFYSKAVLASNSLTSLNGILEKHYAKLTPDFPNYKTLNEVYQLKLLGKNFLLTEAKELVAKMYEQMAQQNIAGVQQILQEFINQRTQFLTGSQDDDSTRSSTKERLITLFQLVLALKKAKRRVPVSAVLAFVCKNPQLFGYLFLLIFWHGVVAVILHKNPSLPQNIISKAARRITKNIQPPVIVGTTGINSVESVIDNELTQLEREIEALKELLIAESRELAKSIKCSRVRTLSDAMSEMIEW